MVELVWIHLGHRTADKQCVAMSLWQIAAPISLNLAAQPLAKNGCEVGLFGMLLWDFAKDQVKQRIVKGMTRMPRHLATYL